MVLTLTTLSVQACNSVKVSERTTHVFSFSEEGEKCIKMNTFTYDNFYTIASQNCQVYMKIFCKSNYPATITKSSEGEISCNFKTERKGTERSDTICL